MKKKRNYTITEAGKEIHHKDRVRLESKERRGDGFCWKPEGGKDHCEGTTLNGGEGGGCYQDFSRFSLSGRAGKARKSSPLQDRGKTDFLVLCKRKTGSH